MGQRRRGHGEGSVYKREDGVWCASVDLGVVNGKRKRKMVYGKTRKEVAEKLKVVQRDRAAGQLFGPLKVADQQADGFGPGAQFLQHSAAHVAGAASQ